MKNPPSLSLGYWLGAGVTLPACHSVDVMRFAIWTSSQNGWIQFYQHHWALGLVMFGSEVNVWWCVSFSDSANIESNNNAYVYRDNYFIINIILWFILPTTGKKIHKLKVQFRLSSYGEWKKKQTNERIQCKSQYTKHKSNSLSSEWKFYQRTNYDWIGWCAIWSSHINLFPTYH